ncbi:hypothetical protein ColTof3_03647 [Colletotrichum tofieldiae]|nr:hypothetical protein ColTof3_03647 [Colletotrichum tofieldiae]
MAVSNSGTMELSTYSSLNLEFLVGILACRASSGTSDLALDEPPALLLSGDVLCDRVDKRSPLMLQITV